MRAEDVMARDVLTVSAATTIETAIGLMLEHRVSALPVLDADGKLVGIISEGDLLRRAETGTGERRRSRLLEFLIGPGREAEEYVQTHSRQVGDLMTRDVVTVGTAATLDDVVTLMEKHHIRRVVVMHDNRLAGIVSRSDLLRALGKTLAAAPAQGGSDDAIKANLARELAASTWASSSNIGINVDNGVVTFDGFIYDERMRQALTVAAQNTPGVRGVVDRMVWLDATTGMTVPV